MSLEVRLLYTDNPTNTQAETAASQSPQAQNSHATQPCCRSDLRLDILLGLRARYATFYSGLMLDPSVLGH